MMTDNERMNVKGVVRTVGGKDLDQMLASGEALTAQQVCALYGFTRQNVSFYSGGLLPEIRDGRNRYYLKEDIEAWRKALKFQRRTAATQ